MRVLGGVLLGLFLLAGAARGQLGLDPQRLAGPASTESEASPLAGFQVGFNQGWWLTHYGSQWTRELDRDHVRKMVAATARFAGPGAVLRVWLFEGANPGGVLWDGEESPAASAPRGSHRTRPTGLDPRVRENWSWFLGLCEEHGVQAYPTLFDGNVSDFDPGPHRKAEYWNVLNEEYGAGQGFREEVLGPLLEAMAERRGAVFGLDLVNEVNNLVSDHWFEGGWTGAVRFVGRWRAFVRARVPGLPVTASLGHHTATRHMLQGRLPRSVVDFYDFHLYNDTGAIPREGDVESLAAEFPVVLGEFGQKASRFDDALQARVTRAFTSNARRLGLRGAFAWRLWDIRPGHNLQARHSYYASGAWRPATSALR
jgi:hypothetical protein